MGVEFFPCDLCGTTISDHHPDLGNCLRCMSKFCKDCKLLSSSEAMRDELEDDLPDCKLCTRRRGLWQPTEAQVAEYALKKAHMTLDDALAKLGMSAEQVKQELYESESTPSTDELVHELVQNLPFWEKKKAYDFVKKLAFENGDGPMSTVNEKTGEVEMESDESYVVGWWRELMEHPQRLLILGLSQEEAERIYWRGYEDPDEEPDESKKVLIDRLVIAADLSASADAEACPL